MLRKNVKNKDVGRKSKISRKWMSAGMRCGVTVVVMTQGNASGAGPGIEPLSEPVWGSAVAGEWRKPDPRPRI